MSGNDEARCIDPLLLSSRCEVAYKPIRRKTEGRGAGRSHRLRPWRCSLRVAPQVMLAWRRSYGVVDGAVVGYWKTVEVVGAVVGYDNHVMVVGAAVTVGAPVVVVGRPDVVVTTSAASGSGQKMAVALSIAAFRPRSPEPNAICASSRKSLRLSAGHLSDASMMSSHWR